MEEILPEGYKMTELGPLPEEWRVVRLGEVVAKIDSGDWGNESASPDTIRAYVLRGTDFERAFRNDLTRIPIRYLRTSSVDRRKVGPGDLLVELSGGSKDQPTGRVLLIHENLIKRARYPICFTNFVKRLRLRSNVDPNHIFYLWQMLYMEGITRIYEKRTTGIRNFKLLDFLENQRIPLPPLPEQRAIAHVLRTVQEAKEATERVIAALRELKKSLMRYLFTYGPVPVDQADQVPLKETEIGPIPAHWQVVKLEEVVQETEQTNPRKDPDLQFRYIDVSCISNESLKIVAYQNLYGKDAPSRARKQVKAGDIIFATVRPYLKRIAIVPSELDNQICSTAFCVLRPKSEVVNGTYLFFAVSRPQFVTSVVEHQRGSSYPAVTDSDVLRCLIPFPPLPEQRAIAEVLRAVDRKIEAEESHKQALDTLFRSLLHNLMTAKIRLPPDFIAQFAAPSSKGDGNHGATRGA